MTPSIRYPAGPITPHGAYWLLNDRIPNVKLRSYDDTVVFNLMGGEAIADQTMPERVELKDIKGLVPPWQTIDQKGATQDGVTFIDALYDPIEIELDVVAVGRNPAWCRKVTNHLFASIDAKQVSEFSWWTHEMGRWWAPVRWFKTPANPWKLSRRQEHSLRLRADSGFWQSYPNVGQFQFAYEDMTDTFTTDRTAQHDLGSEWPQLYSGAGGGSCYSNGAQAVWLDDPNDPIDTQPREVVNGPKNNFNTDTDNQVVNMVFGSFQEWAIFDGADNDLWARMSRNADGTWKGDGIRARIGPGFARLSYFVNFVEHVIKEYGLLNIETWIPPLPGEKFTLVAGVTDANGVPRPRSYRILRNGANFMNADEDGTTSKVGAAYRGVGFGMRAGAALITQATPAGVRKISAGDNATETQSGFIQRVNAGDQDAWDRHTLFGPGTFRIWDGPGAGPDEYVEFGPLLAGQIVQIRTDPRKYSVRDLTVRPNIVAPTAQVDAFQKALNDIGSFLQNALAGPAQILQSITGLFGGSSSGYAPPQGNLYALLKGRFDNPIPPKPAGKPCTPYYIKVEIVNGNADSMVMSALTPLRRYPY